MISGYLKAAGIAVRSRGRPSDLIQSGAYRSAERTSRKTRADGGNNSLRIASC